VPGVGTYRGMSGFMDFMRTWTGAFETWSTELEALIDPGGDRIVALMHQSGTGKGSGAPVDLRYGGVHRFEDGRLVETRLYLTAAEALEAVGLSPWYAKGFQLYAERGPAGLAETWHEDVVYEEDPLFPGAATYRGRDAVFDRFREYEEQLGRSDVAIEGIVERPQAVVVTWRHSGVTPASGVPFERRWAWVMQERDGRAIHIRAYVDPEEALRAVESGGT
jgi:ketosteroid isomerase-like protein